MLNIGDVVLRYRIVEIVGRGGTGIIYHVEEIPSGRRLAMKVIDWSAPRRSIDLARTRKEAAAAQALNDPHICRLESIEDTDGSLCVVMELLDGTSLDLLVKGKPLPETTVIAYARDIAAALEAAHKNAVLHLDLKPSKIMVTAGGLKVLDLGFGSIMKRARGQGLTATADISLSLSYASPEQVTQQPTDARSDVFSFGAMLYEMATGVTPFQAVTPVEVMRRIQNSAPARPSTLNAQLSPALERIILKALEKDRDRRYQHASEIVADLAALAPDRLQIAPPDPPPAAATRPTTIGRYRIIRTLGVGSASEVLLANDPLLDRPVAIKRLRTGLGSDHVPQLSMAEWKVLSRLHNPNIVEIFEYGEQDGSPFLVMEYVDGQTMADVIRRQSQVPLGRRLEWMDAICNALAHAHAAGVLHRDVKPANVMIGKDSRVKVIDFGIAPTTMGRPDVVVGTPGYISPEHLSGEAIDARSDMFSAGALFYELLSSRQAFPGGPGSGVVNAILSDQPEPLETLVPGLDPRLIAIVNRCLEKDPGRRYANMDDVRAALAAARANLRASTTLLDSLVAEFPPGASSTTGASGGHVGAAARPASSPITGAFDPRPAAPSPPAHKTRLPAPAPEPTPRLGASAGSAFAASEAGADVLDRTLDVAVPSPVAVHASMELVALLRLPASPSLQQILDDEGEGELSRGVRSRGFGMEFLRDAGGRLRASTVTMRVVAPDFNPPEITKVVRVRPDRDCERQVFLLRPTSEGRLKIQFDVLVGDITLTSRSLQTTVAPAGAPSARTMRSLVSMPLEVHVHRWPVVKAASATRRFVSNHLVAVFVGTSVALGVMRGLSNLMTTGFGPATQAGRETLTVGPRGIRPATSEAGAPISAGPSYALVIGIDDYASLPHLHTAVNDARAVGAALRDRYGFVTEVLENATRYQLLSALNRYRSTAHEGDSLLIYYAGHGHYDKDADKAYWLPADAQPDNSANWIIADDITSDIRVIPAKHILVIADSCYSGGLTRDAAVFTPEERSRYLVKMAAGKSRTLLASGGNEPVADGGGSGDHSVFAAAFLAGLQAMPSTTFAAHELFNDYIGIPVAGRSQQTPQYLFIRNSGHDAGDFLFFRKPGP